MNITNLVRSRVQTFSLEVNITNLAGSKVKARRITCGDWKALAVYQTHVLKESFECSARRWLWQNVTPRVCEVLSVVRGAGCGIMLRHASAKWGAASVRTSSEIEHLAVQRKSNDAVICNVLYFVVECERLIMILKVTDRIVWFL